jgi:hypothetical protein
MPEERLKGGGSKVESRNLRMNERAERAEAVGQIEEDAMTKKRKRMKMG